MNEIQKMMEMQKMPFFGQNLLVPAIFSSAFKGNPKLLKGSHKPQPPQITDSEKLHMDYHDIKAIEAAAFSYDKFYTRAEVAKALRISVATLDRMRKRQQLPEPVRVASQLRWTGEQLNSWAELQTAGNQCSRANRFAQWDANKINNGEKGFQNAL